MKNFPTSLTFWKAHLPNSNYFRIYVLEDDENIIVVLESLVNFDYLRMIERCKNKELFEEICRTFYVFLFDAFYCSGWIGIVLHFAFVDDSKRTAADCLRGTWFTD